MRNSNVIFNPEAHTYHFEGVQLQGITGVIKKHLFPNQYKDVPEYILKKAAQRGTLIHEDLITADIFGTNDTFEQVNYLELKNKYNIDVLENEYLVTDYQNFATAIDKVVKINNEYYLIDVKTTYVLNKEYLSWQLSIGHFLFSIVNPDIEIKGYKAIWVRDDVTLHDIEPIPFEEVKKLLEAEVNGEMYQNFQVATDESEKALMLIRRIEEIEENAKKAEAEKKELRAILEKKFNEMGVDKWENDSFIITKTKDYTRPIFQSKKFQEDYPDLHKEYIKDTIIKGSIKYNAKDKQEAIKD